MSFSPNSRSSSGVEERPGSLLAAAAPTQPLIIYQGISKYFDDHMVLQNINLEIFPGKSTVILGRSGSGKTVLTSMLVGLTMPDEGTLTVAGVEVTKFKSDEEWRELRLKTGYLFQGSALYDFMTVGENVAFPMEQHTHWPEQEIEERVRQKLSQVGLEGVMDLEPAALSGGMKRRAALARSLALDPEIIIYDEPTSGLDPITGEEICDLMRQLQETLKVTSVVVSHDLRLTELVADRVALLYQGSIAFWGTVEEFWQSPQAEARRFLHKDSQEESKL